MTHPKFPGWRYGPKGEKAIFEREEDVPEGWHDHPSKHENADSAASQNSSSPGKAEIDAHGHPFNSEIHADAAPKTKEGLWRMKVGVKRPDPMPGYPLDL